MYGVAWNLIHRVCQRFMSDNVHKYSPEPNTVGAGRSAGVVRVASRHWFGYLF